MHMMFVYGTLKRGFPNHELWMEKHRFVGQFQTRNSFPLVVAGKWHSPVVIAEPGKGHKISGEVYIVDDQGLFELDRIEGTHLVGGYNRILLEVEMIEAGIFHDTWSYVKNRSSIDVIHDELTGDYLRDPRYVPASQRLT